MRNSYIRTIAYLVVVLLVMWTGVSIATADTIPPSPVTATDWKGILSVLGVILFGIGSFCSGVAKLLHLIGPMTKTTLDDRAAAKLDQVAEVVYAVRDHVLGLVKMASGPQQVQTDPAPAPVLAVVPPSRSPQAGRARVAVLVLVALAIGVPVAAFLELSAGCATIKADAKKAEVAIIDCTKADAVAIGAVVAAIGSQAAVAALTHGAIDWSAIESAAAAQGKVVGGCALAGFVVALAKAPPDNTAVAGLMAPPDPLADAHDTLNRLRARFGGVQWQTDSGVM